jgi:hypothetical protein
MKTIADTSKMKCTLGAGVSTLKVTSQTHDKVNGQLQATEKDKQFPVNIAPFGLCSSLKSVCQCKPTQWQKTSYSTIDNNKELNSDSFMMCSIGGKITFIDTGVNGFVSSEGVNKSQSKKDSNTKQEKKQEESTSQQSSSSNQPYRTYKGKDYTKEEWKKFDDEQYAIYKAKRNKQSFWSKLFG